MENFTPSDQCWCWLVQNCSSWEVKPILFIIPLHFPCLLRASLLHTSTTFFSSLQFKVQLRSCHTSSRQPQHCHNHLLISDKATMSVMRCAMYNSGDWHWSAVEAGPELCWGHRWCWHCVSPPTAAHCKLYWSGPHTATATTATRHHRQAAQGCSRRRRLPLVSALSTSDTTLQQPGAVIQTIPTLHPRHHCTYTGGTQTLFSHPQRNQAI